MLATGLTNPFGDGPVDQRKIACFASRRPWVQIPSGPLRLTISFEKSNAI